MKKYEIVVKPLEPISIGAGREDNVLTVLQVPVIQVGEDNVIYDYRRPIIPASSFKGVLRSIGVAIAKGLGVDHDESCLNPPCHVSEQSREIERYVERYKEYVVKNLGGDVTSVKKDALRKVVASLQCPVCLLFGAPGVASLLRITDLIPGKYTIQRVSRVTINRALRTKSEGKLFTIEMVDADLFMGYALYYINPCLKEMLEKVFGKERKEEILNNVEKLWDMVIKFVEESGLEVGHSRSTGLGRVKVEFREIKGKYSHDDNVA